MKTQNERLTKAILFLLIFLTAVFMKAETTKTDTLSGSALSFLQAPPDAKYFNYSLQRVLIAGDGYGYGNDVWTNELFSFDPDDLSTLSAETPLAIMSSSGDFEAGDPQHMWMLHASDQYMARVDITNGSEDQIVTLPMPVENAFWTVLTIHPATGEFFVVATTGEQSDLYLINQVSGTLDHVMSLGIPGVISGTFDGEGMLYLFDIALDEIWQVDVQNATTSMLGPAGFDGNFSQGMGYDSWSDRIYLAAYNNIDGPELRLLDRFTGATTLIGALPGETTGFGFPASVGQNDFLMAGQDLYTVPAATLIFGDDLPTIPQGFFDPGSLPFDGPIPLKGLNSDGGLLPHVDLTIDRLGDIPLLAPIPSEGEVQIEIVQLNLTSTQPIIVQTGTGESMWDVELHLVPSMPQQGNLLATKQNLNGGDFSMDFVLMPELIFREVDNPDNVRYFNPSEFGFTGLQLFAGDPLPWMAPPIAHEFDPFWSGGMSLHTPAGSDIILVPLLHRQDHAFLSMNEEGVPEEWEGTGFNDSEWFYYPNFNWWNVWFYDHPLAVNRRKFVGGVFTIMPRDPSQPSSVEVILGWSTPEWATWNGFPENASPPLPEDVIEPDVELQMIERTETIYQSDGVFETISVPIPSEELNNLTGLYNFNPEWIFIDVRGYNFMIYGELDHTCFKPWNSCEVQCPEDMEVCATDEPFGLSGASPAGGIYSGSGVSADGVFDPGNANWGENIISYTYICPDGTTVSCDFIIYVIPPPEMVCPPNMEVCYSDGVISLSDGNPGGGTFAGPGMVGGNSFSTIQAGVGTHTITYTVTEPCPGSCSFTITVHPNPEVDCPGDFEMCESDDPIDLMTMVSPQGGTFTGGQMFDPGSSVGGPWQIKYTYTDPVTGCTGSCVFYITVHPNPDVNCPDDFTMCEDDAPIDLMTLVSPQGGSFSGGQMFDPSTAPPGVPLQIKYTYVDPQTGCEASCIFYITVWPKPDVECPDDMEVCIDDGNVTLSASPAGGSFSGAGISGNQFNPSGAGLGIHTIEYCYTDLQTGCEGCCEFTVTVHPKPEVNCPADIEVCVDEAPFALTGATPAGGQYSDFQGNVLNIFNPAAAGVGLYIIYYDYTDPQTGCTNYCFFTITVHPLPLVNCPPNMSVCLNDPAFALGGATPAGGTYSGVGVAGGNFSPANAGAGIHTISYEYTDPITGCTNSCTFEIEVHDLPLVTCPPDFAVCVDAVPFGLTGGMPAGGNYSGPGVAGGIFNAAAAGAGKHDITYSYTDPVTGCTNSCTFEIEVHDLPDVDCPNDVTVCSTDPIFSLIGAASPAGGVYTGIGVIAGGNFDPSAAAIGPNVITYTYTDIQTGCINKCTFTINVVLGPAVTCPPAMTVCESDASFALAGGTPAGGTYSGTGVSSGNFYPGTAGAGAHIITYSYTSPVTGCTGTCTFVITVLPNPVVTCPGNMEVCIDDGPFVLPQGNPGGGWHVGPGVAGGIFNPAAAGVGIKTIVYRYTSPVTGCTGSCSFTIKVNSLPVLNCSNLTVCIHDGIINLTNATPAGGTYAGPGIIGGNKFNPQAVGKGVYNITYTYQDPITGCENQCPFTITVEDPTVNCPSDTAVCENDPAFILSGATPAGGVYSGIGVSLVGGNYEFDPSAWGPGTVTIEYIYTLPGTNCSDTCDFDIIIHENPQVNCPSNDTVCESGADFTLGGATPVGGTYFIGGTPVSIFKPSWGPGTYPVNYIYTDTTGCADSCTFNIVVRPDPVVTCPADLSVFLYDPAFPLAGATPAGGVYTDTSGAVVTLFDPLAAGVGNHNITYTYTDSNGCSGSCEYWINVFNYYDYGDAPDGPYPTLLANNGARHETDGLLFMGSMVDGEPDGQPTIGADGDDLNLLDDEDGVSFITAFVQGQVATLEVATSTWCKLNAWFDFNQINAWTDAGEHVFNDVSLAPGVNTLSFVVPSGASIGDTYARFRVNYNGGISFDDYGYEGEVEDYVVTITESSADSDFGDAPQDSTLGFFYPTTIANNGAQHIIDPDVFLGILIDAEGDGQPSLNAKGDDFNALGDEDGVRFARRMAVGHLAKIRVKASVDGYLNAWVDFDSNGTWAEAGDQIFTDQPLTLGWNTLFFSVPAGISPGKTYARFRFNTAGGLGYDSIAADGEVEDYRARIFPHNWHVVATELTHQIVVPTDLTQVLFAGDAFMLMPDDFIGVFYDDDGTHHCGGAIQWDGTENQTLTAFGDDPLTPEKDGFNEDEDFVLLVYRPSTGETFYVEAGFDPELPNADGKFHANGLSAFINMSHLGQAQTLAIPEGWSGVSTYVDPLGNGVASLFNPIINDLVLLYNLEGMFWPGQNLNTLGQWDVQNGHVVKLIDDAMLTVWGDELSDKSVHLGQGWNIIPVLSPEPFDVELLFSTLPGMVLVKEVAGSGVYLPGYNINTIGDVLPGSAYYVLTNQSGVISYAAGSSTSVSGSSPSSTTKITSPFSDVTFTPESHIVVFNLADSPIMPEDVIAAFTGAGQCAGLVMVEDGKFALTVNGNDSYAESQTGFLQGELLNYKLYRKATDEILDLEVNYNPAMTPGVFTSNGLSEVVGLKTSSTGWSDAIEHDISIYPNPSKGVFNISGIDGNVEITVLDMFGKEILDGNYETLHEINLTGNPEGIYFVKIKTRDGFESTRKLIVH